jgi:serine/threonine-protein kinase
VLYRWHKAYTQGDSARGRAIADSIDLSEYVYGMDQITFYDGTGVQDVRRGLDTALKKVTSDQARRGIERLAHDFELVAGRPSAALAHVVASADSGNDVNVPILKVRDALIADGDTAAAADAVRALIPWDAGPISSDTVRRANQRAATRVLEPWRLAHGDTSQTRRSLERLRTIARPLTGARKIDAEIEIAVIEAMRADVARSPELQAVTLRLDSLLRVTDYVTASPGRMSFANLVAARLLEKLGDNRGALAAARRRTDVWTQNNPYLATQLREQGRLAALVGEREEAIRAYRHYLALRLDPEPAIRPQVEAVRRELSQLEKASAGK